MKSLITVIVRLMMTVKKLSKSLIGKVLKSTVWKKKKRWWKFQFFWIPLRVQKRVAKISGIKSDPREFYRSSSKKEDNPAVFLFIFEYKKTCILASLFLRTIINMFIQMIFINIITYLDITFRRGKNHINFRMK